MAWCTAIILISLKVFLMNFLGISNFSLIIFIDGMCVDALASAVMTINGSTFHPLLVILSISGWYFSVLMFIVSCENLSLQYVNLMNWMVRLLSGFSGGLDW